MQCPLDRALIVGWFDFFPNAKLLSLERELSNHEPIKLNMNAQAGKKSFKGELFRFEQTWTENEGCEGIIENA